MSSFRWMSIVLICSIVSHVFAQKKQITEDFPYFGEITMEKVGDKTYEAPVEDTALGPIQLAEGTARKVDKKATITFEKGSVAGKQFRVVFDKKRAPLTGGIKGERILTGQVETLDEKPLKLYGVTFESAQININETTKQVFLEGRFEKFGLTFIGQFIGAIEGAKLTFDASLEKAPKNFKPFREISEDAPDFLKDIQLNKIRVGVKAEFTLGGEEEAEENGGNDDEEEEDGGGIYGAIYLEGNVSGIPLLRKPLLGRVELGVEKLPQVTLLLSLQEGWKLSDLAPKQITGDIRDAVNSIILKDAMFVATTQDQFMHKNTNFEQGFNFYAVIGFPEKGKNKYVDILRNVQDDLKIPLTVESELFGNFNPLARSFHVEALQGFDGLSFELGNFTFDNGKMGYKLQVKPKKVTFGLVGQFDLQPPQEDKPLTFSAGFEVETPTQVGGYLSMEETWENPLGIKGVSVGNLGVSAKHSIAQISSTAGIGSLIPAEAGLTGDASLRFTEDTETSGKFTLQAGTDVSDFAFDIQVKDAPNLPDIASFILRQLNQKVDIPIDKIVPLEVHKARIQLVPLGTTIGALRIEQGIGCELDITALGHDGKLDMGASFKDTGIICKGSLDPIHIGPLHIEGVEGADRPQFDYQLNLKNQNAILKGNLYIGDKDNPVMQARTDMTMKPMGANFLFDYSFGPFSACVRGETDKVNEMPEDFTLTIDFQQDLISSVSDTIQKLGSKVSQFIDKIAETKEELQGKIQQQEKKVQSKKKELREKEKMVKRRIAEAIERKKAEIIERKKAEKIEREKAKRVEREVAQPIRR